MKKKLLLFLIIATVVVAGGFLVIQKQFFQKDSSNLSDNNINENSNKDNIYYLEYEASYALDLNDSNAMYDGHEFIAIIHVNKLNPATTYREKTDEYIMPFTSGEATVLKVLKGNFNSEKISFLRLGGTVFYRDYEKSLAPSAREKFSALFTESEKATKLINDKFKGDINIENDKTYLVYMNRSDDFHNKNEYTIEAFEYGLREVNFGSGAYSLDSTNITIKNNKTGEYEKLENAVSKKLIKKTNSITK